MLYSFSSVFSIFSSKLEVYDGTALPRAYKKKRKEKKQDQYGPSNSNDVNEVMPSPPSHSNRRVLPRRSRGGGGNKEHTASRHDHPTHPLILHELIRHLGHIIQQLRESLAPGFPLGSGEPVRHISDCSQAEENEQIARRAERNRKSQACGER